MKLMLPRDALLKPLQMVMGVVDRKQALPILSHILFKIKDNRISVVGTDLEIELTGNSPFSEHNAPPAQLTLPGRKLLDICRALPENASIELYQDKQQVILRSQRSRFILSTLPAEDYPNTESQQVHLQLKLPQQDLLNLLQRTHFAMAQQDVRYYLNGMLFEFKPGTLRTVATDGHRLATNVIRVPIQEEHKLQVIVPRKGVLELMRLLSNTDEEITLSVGNSYVQAIADRYTFLSKLIDGRFPDYERVIPRQGDKQIVVSRETLKQALIRSAILCNEKVQGVFFELKSNMLRLLANNTEQELAEEEISVDYTGPELGLAFNTHYLLDVLNTLESEEVRLIFSSTNNNCLLIEELNSDKEQAFVIMPMRI